MFEEGKQALQPIPLLGRKHLLLDASIAERIDHITFTVNPPRRAERVIDAIKGPFRKHLTVVEDEAGLIRMYYGVKEDHLAVLTSRDGIHWEKPVLAPGADEALQNVVLGEPAATGVVFIDPNGPAEERWKLVTGYEGRGIYLYTSRDGWAFRRHPIALLPFRAASQSASSTTSRESSTWVTIEPTIPQRLRARRNASSCEPRPATCPDPGRLCP